MAGFYSEPSSFNTRYGDWHDTPHVSSYNSHGKKYKVPRRQVFSLHELQRGDHIVFHRLNGAFWHHAIVENIVFRWDEIKVIEFNNTTKGFINDNFKRPKTPRIASVVRGTYKFRDPDEVFLMLHEQCLDPESVVSNALRELALGRGNYNPITNNCEHFAMRCKTGRSSSDQVNKVGEMVSKEIGSKGAGAAFAKKIGKLFVEKGARVASKEGQRMLVREGARVASKAGQRVLVREGARVASNAGLRVLAREGALEASKAGLRVLAREGARVASKAGQRVLVIEGARVASKAGQRVLVREGARVASKAGQRVLVREGARVASKAGQRMLVREGARVASKAGQRVFVREGTRVVARAGQTVSAAGQGVAMSSTSAIAPIVGEAVFATVTESLFMLNDINRARADMQAGRINQREFKDVLVKRIVTGASNIAGTTLGTAIGQAVIPVPILGGVVGGIVGGLAGSFFGNIIANS